MPIRRGVATFTLDYGKCPPQLFERMVKLGRGIIEALIEEFGPDEFIRRIADPVWFQALGTVLAFDWNASGLTTILTAALREAIEEREEEWGVFICGGKGKTSRKTPDQILTWGERIAFPEAGVNNLVYNSKMSAKVDSALVQDGFQLYHHAFFFSKNGAWSVVQQGMNAKIGAARRYHWFSEDAKDLVREPHSGISSQKVLDRVLDLTADASTKTRDISTELVNAGYAPVMNEINLLRKYSTPFTKMAKLSINDNQLTLLKLEDREFKYHPVVKEDFTKSKYLEKVLAKVTEIKPENYEKLLAIEGVGPKTLRALALVGEVIYGAQPSYEDPARYSFAHGGKDGTPYLPDYKTYDNTISTLDTAIRRSKLEKVEKAGALDRLQKKIDFK